MAALLVALAVMAVLMTAALPAWRFQAKREKELELVFRGEQYMRAIGLYERRMGPGSRPPTIDVLVEQRFLRKKYKDPMTEDGEFQPLYLGVQPTPDGGRGGQRGAGPGMQPPSPPGSFGGRGGAQPGGAGGIIGVVSKSKEASIRLYQGKSKYNEWTFIFAGLNNRPGMPGGGGPGAQRPGMPGTGPGGRGPGGRGAPGPASPGGGPGGTGSRPFPGRGGRGPG
jgi:type II secretory pathway pseudopilin PulG